VVFLRTISLLPLFCLCLVADSDAYAQETTPKRLSSVPAPQRESFETQTKMAVVVGVGEYGQGSGLNSLKYSVRDAQALTDELHRQGYAVRLLLDSRATSDFILQAIADAAKTLQPNEGTILFFFSGHGFSDEKRRNYLATYGTTIDDLTAGLSLAEVQAAMEASKARRRILWIDACRNNPFRGARTVEGRSFSDFQAAAGTRILLSTQIGAFSYEDDRLQQGVFTHFLLEGLRGAAAGSDHLVTFEDLATYVSEAAGKWSFERGYRQTPVEKSDRTTGDFLVATVTPEPNHNMATTAPFPSAPLPTVSRAPAAIEQSASTVDGQTYVRVHAGSFAMGCSQTDQTCLADEVPPHAVSLTHDFWIGQSEVTVEAYTRVAEKMGIPIVPAPEFNPNWQDRKQPIVNVTWENAASFCRAVGGRLPTEAEWEYAARGGQADLAYPVGAAISHDDANYSGTGGKDRFGASPAPVGSFQANGFGLLDMSGNVSEWVADWYAPYEGGMQVDPHGPDAGSLKVTRGGAWNSLPKSLRNSSRHAEDPGVARPTIGFRCVITNP
jgi:formylglycine-generating enzyme required for sulfatase activity